MEEFTTQLFKGVEEIVELIQSGGGELGEESGEVGAGGDKSLLIDLKAEEILISRLGRFGTIVSEERGVVEGSGGKIVIDPIDGSYNFKNGVPYYGLSVYWEGGVGLVVNLSNGDFFLREKEKKSRGNLFHPNKKWIKGKGEVVIFEKAYENLELCKKLQKHRVKFRSPGALSLSLAYGEEYRGVIFRGKIREFDIAGPKFYNRELNWYISPEEELIVMAPDPAEFQTLLQIVKG
jgi:myo-inositol-1(or 4)-monophosphatase